MLGSARYPNIQWGKLLDDLERAGYSTAAISREFNIPWSTVKGWRQHEPSGSYAIWLVDLHKRCFPQPSNFISPNHETA